MARAASRRLVRVGMPECWSVSIYAGLRTRDWATRNPRRFARSAGEPAVMRPPGPHLEPRSRPTERHAPHARTKTPRVGLRGPLDGPASDPKPAVRPLSGPWPRTVHGPRGSGQERHPQRNRAVRPLSGPWPRAVHGLALSTDPSKRPGAPSATKPAGLPVPRGHIHLEGAGRPGEDAGTCAG